MNLSDEPVLLDTSIWIASFRGNPQDVTTITKQLLNEDLVVTCGPVLFEVRRGLRASERNRIMLLMGAIPCLSFIEEDWEHAGDLDASLRSKGITVPPMDSLIAHICSKYDIPLYTLDKHFDSVDKIRLFKPV